MFFFILFFYVKHMVIYTFWEELQGLMLFYGISNIKKRLMGGKSILSVSFWSIYKIFYWIFLPKRYIWTGWYHDPLKCKKKYILFT